jgi:phosphoadenosine phosphosulfate reductase
MKEEEISRLNNELKDKTAQEIIVYFLKRYGGARIALASGLGQEDQVLTDMILKIDKSSRIFTIDTGRLFPETYSLIDKTNICYDIKMEVYFPENTCVEDYVKKNGINAFYESVEKRKECCRVRKIRPLLRALSTLDAWICGLRREQSVTRTGVEPVEWDRANDLLKVNPLAYWKEDQVWDYIKSNNVPFNTLYKKGFPSIGCQPCTRSVKEGEDIRAGRWWWENPEQKECGLHKR